MVGMCQHLAGAFHQQKLHTPSCQGISDCVAPVTSPLPPSVLVVCGVTKEALAVDDPSCGGGRWGRVGSASSCAW